MPLGPSSSGVARKPKGGGGGGFLSTVEHGIGKALVPFKSIVPDLINVGEHAVPGLIHLVEDPSLLKQMPGQIYHDISDPSMWYRHPLYPLLDLASVIPTPLAAVSRAAEVSRVLGGTSRLAIPAAERAAADTAAATAMRSGEVGSEPVWYHGTTETGATQIGREGFIRPASGMGRATSEAHVFLTRDPAEATKYGPVVIPVKESDIPVTPGSKPLAERGNVIAVSSRVPVEGAAREVGAASTSTPASLGSQLTHALIYGPPVQPRVFWERPINPATGERLARGERVKGVASTPHLQPTGYSRNVAIRGGQKLLDQFHETHPDLHIPGVFGKQGKRIYKAEFQQRLTSQGLAKVEAVKLVKEFGKLPDAMQEAIHMIGRGVNPEHQIAYIRNELLPHLHGLALQRAEKALARTEEAAPYLTTHMVTTGPTRQLITEGEPTVLPAEKREFAIPQKFAGEHLGKYPSLKNSVLGAGKSGPVRVTLDPATYDRMLKHALRVSEKGDKYQKQSARATIDRLEAAGRPKEGGEQPFLPHEVEMHPGGVYRLPTLNPDHPEFKTMQNFLRQTQKVSNLRTQGFEKLGMLNRSDEVVRTLGPKNLIEGHGLIPNLVTLRANLRNARNFGQSEKAAALEKEIQFWEMKRGDIPPNDALEAPSGAKTDMITDPGLAQHLFRIPEMESVPSNVNGFLRAWRGAKPEIPSSLNHAYEGLMEKYGFGDPNVAKTVAASYQEYARFAYLTKVRGRVLAAAQSTPAGIPDQYRLPLVEEYWNGRLGPGFNFPEEMLQQAGAYSDDEAQGIARWYDAVRSRLMDPSSALEYANKNFGAHFTSERQLETITIPGIRWIDKRMLGGLDKQNPLWSAMALPGVGKVLHAMDAVNEAQKMMILYLKPAYVLPNFLGNVGLTLVHQGFLAPINMVRTLRLMFTGKGMTAESAATIKAIMGAGTTGVLRPSRTIFGRVQRGSARVAEAYGKVIDDPMRFSSFLHEANAAGFRTADDIHRLTTDPSLEDTLNEVGTRANDALINYERLGPGEQAVLRRLIFFYPWVKGSTRYGYQLVINHPTAASFTGQESRQGEEWQQQMLGDVPSFLEGAVPFSGGRIINASSAAILQQPADVLKMGYNMFTRNPDATVNTFESLPPAESFLYTLLTGHTDVPASLQDSYLRRALGGLTGSIPLLQLVQNAKAGFPDRPTRLYPHDDARSQLLKFGVFGGLYPRDYNKLRGTYDAWLAAHPQGYGK